MLRDERLTKEGPALAVIAAYAGFGKAAHAAKTLITEGRKLSVSQERNILLGTLNSEVVPTLERLYAGFERVIATTHIRFNETIALREMLGAEADLRGRVNADIVGYVSGAFAEDQGLSGRISAQLGRGGDHYVPHAKLLVLQPGYEQTPVAVYGQVRSPCGVKTSCDDRGSGGAREHESVDNCTSKAESLCRQYGQCLAMEVLVAAQKKGAATDKQPCSAVHLGDGVAAAAVDEARSAIYLMGRVVGVRRIFQGRQSGGEAYQRIANRLGEIQTFADTVGRALLQYQDRLAVR